MQYFQTLSGLFKIPKTYTYIVVTVLTVYILAVILSQGVNMWNIFMLDVPFLAKASALTSFFTSILDTFSYQSLGIMLMTACIVGLQFSLVRLYAKNRLYLAQNKLNVVGIGATFLGCMACCGSIVFSIISSVVGVSLQGLLPFGGIEFSYIGLLIASVACFVTLRKYHRPQTC